MRKIKKVKDLIKTSFNIYKDRGFLSLSNRIKDYLLNEIGVIFFKKANILYISGCPGGSKFYRCQNQAEEFSLYGISSNIVSQNNSKIINLIKKHQIFIFQRVIFNDFIKIVLNEIKKQKKIAIFETDDLVFDPTYIKHMDYYTHMSEQEKSWYSNGIGREILEDSYVKNCIVSTDFLAEKIKEKYPNKNVFISYNKLSKNQVFQAEKTLQKIEKIKKDDGKVRIGYFSGSKSHDKDFKVISDVLFELLQKNSNLILVIVGFLKLDEKFNLVKNQIEFHSFVTLKNLPKLILKTDINLAPLELENPFCQSKSAIKFFEAGILGVPTIATATKSFKKVIKNKENSFLAFDEKDWKNYLNLLIKDEKKRKLVGENAKKSIIKNHLIKKDNTDFKILNFVKGIIDSDSENDK